MAHRPLSASGFAQRVRIPLHDDVDLLVGQHSARVLRKRRHGGSRNSVGGYAANGGIVGNGEINRIAKSDRGAALSIRAVASRTVPGVEKIEVHNLVRRDHLPHPRRMPRVATGRWRDCEQCCRQKYCPRVSRRFVLSAAFVPSCRKLPCPSGERAAARCQRAYAFLPGNHDARDNPECHLRNHKPAPVDALVEHRIHDSENAVE